MKEKRERKKGAEVAPCNVEDGEPWVSCGT